MTVQELRETISQLVALLKATDAKATTIKGLNEFVESTESFGDLQLKAFVKLAEAGKNPPTAKVPTKKSTARSAEEVGSEIKGLYERAADPSVTEEQIQSACGQLSSLTKDNLARIAEGVDLFGMKARKKDEIIREITSRLMERKEAAIRRKLIDRPDSSLNHEAQSAPQLQP